MQNLHIETDHFRNLNQIDKHWQKAKNPNLNFHKNLNLPTNYLNYKGIFRNVSMYVSTL
jgi:hypothetical protein